MAALFPEMITSSTSPLRSGVAAKIISKICSAAFLSLPKPGGGLSSTASSDSASSMYAMSCWFIARSLNSWTFASISSRVGIALGLRPRHRAELHHQLRRVHLGPRLDDPPVGVVAADLDPVDVHRVAVRRDVRPRQPALVRPRHPDVGH